MEPGDPKSEFDANLPTLGGEEEVDDIILQPDPNSVETMLSMRSLNQTSQR